MSHILVEFQSPQGICNRARCPDRAVGGSRYGADNRSALAGGQQISVHQDFSVQVAKVASPIPPLSGWRSKADRKNHSAPSAFAQSESLCPGW